MQASLVGSGIAMGDRVSEPATFSRVICGVDGSPESLTAVRQAARLLEADGALVLIAVANIVKAAQAGMAAVHAADLLQQGAEEALAAAQSEAPSASTRLVYAAVRTVPYPLSWCRRPST